MKRTFLMILLLGSAACTREAAEISPEAIRSYGVPSQTSNFDQHDGDKKSADTDVSWVNSSAVVQKRTVNY